MNRSEQTDGSFLRGLKKLAGGSTQTVFLSTEEDTKVGTLGVKSVNTITLEKSSEGANR